jgi:hypothetical protein
LSLLHPDSVSHSTDSSFPAQIPRPAHQVKVLVFAAVSFGIAFGLCLQSGDRVFRVLGPDAPLPLPTVNLGSLVTHINFQ